MEFISGINRHQMQLCSLEDSINQDNVVRFVDAFVEKLDIEKLGFAVIKLQKEGRPAFDRKVLLKLYFYGYLNGIRSSRRLERECTLNLELTWLLEGRRPNYHTISDFRKLNCDALCNTFKLFVLFLKDMDMIGGKTIAVDGTKARAHNSKKNNYNAKKIERHIKRIEEQTQSYLAEMDANDKNESAPVVKNIKEKLARLASQKIRYEQLAEQLEQSGEPQISTTNKDACKSCPVKHLCTGRKNGGREIERSQYAVAVEVNGATTATIRSYIAGVRKSTNISSEQSSGCGDIAIQT